MNISVKVPKSTQIEPGADRAAFWQFCIYTANRIRLAQSINTATAHDIDKLLVDQNWRCAVSGIQFERPGGRGKGTRAAFGPSLDRIRAGGPYAIGNLRLVCNIVNFAMNNWGEEALRKLVRDSLSQSDGRTRGLAESERTSRERLVHNTPRATGRTMMAKRSYWRDGQWKGTLIVSALMAPIPAGVFLAFYFNNPNWLMLCGFLIFFLS